jgi:uridylate kinase
MFRNYAYKEIVKDPIKKVNFENVLIAGGWKPGWSTDYDAVLLAEQFNSNEVINITNVDYLYDKNPNEFKDAKKIEKTDWKGFKKIVGDKWKPGTNAPFDPVATKKASELGLKLILIGKDIESLKNYLDGKKFKGSVVS